MLKKKACAQNFFCASSARAQRQPFSHAEASKSFEARFDNMFAAEWDSSWERLANFENDAIVALAMAARGQ